MANFGEDCDYLLRSKRPATQVVVVSRACASLVTSIVSPTAYEEMGTDAFGINPVGSGPYTLEKWEPGVEVIMVKNPNYWQEGVGLADRIVWRNFQDGASALLAAQSGELDLLQEQEPKDVPLFEAIPGFKVGADQSGWYSLVLNTRIPPNRIVDWVGSAGYAQSQRAGWH